MILTLHRGGTLTAADWDIERGEFEEEVTAEGFRHLYRICKLEEGVTLRDIFLFIQRHIGILAPILNRYCMELIAEGLAVEKVASDDLAAQRQIEYLELYWPMQEDAAGTTLEGYHFPDFHIIARLMEDGEDHGKKGEQICLSTGGQFHANLMDVEVRLRSDIYVDILHERNGPRRTPREYTGATYTLGHILYGVVYELTWGGSPERQR